jgi:DNA-directed RNA polymerase specialized sigma24 family protein
MSAMPEPKPSVPPLVPDGVLIERLVQRDSTALVELERRHRGSLYAQAYGILMDSNLAERVVRNVFSQLWFAAARFVGTTTPVRALRDMATELARAERALQAPAPRR